MSRHRASSMIHMYGLNYCADHTNGLIYEYSLDIYTDNGDPIIKQRDTAVIHGGLFGVPGKKLFFDEVEFIIVAGETEVAGTGLGPQPPTEVIPLTDCNEIWQIGTIVPDLHVGGQDTVTGIWNGDVIVGTGVLEDDRADNIHTTNDTDNYTLYAGFNPGVEDGVAEVFYPECQWYNYAGPLLFNQMAGTTFDLSDAEWTKFGTPTFAFADGLDGATAWSVIMTDDNPAGTEGAFKPTQLSSLPVDTEPFVTRFAFHKAASAQDDSKLIANPDGGDGIEVFFNAFTGVATLGTGAGPNQAFEVRDNVDWWEVFLQVDADNSSTRVIASMTTSTSSGTGDLRVADVAVFVHNTIGMVRGGAIEPKKSAAGPSSVIDISNVHIDSANHDDSEGGYYFEWRPLYSHAEITRDVEILSLNDSTGLLYYDWSEQLLTATDGVNIATVSLTLVKETKYRLGVIFGDNLRVGVDGVWGTPVAYDGAFPGGSDFTINRNSEAVNYWRELRGFVLPYLEAFNEITLLMGGIGTGSTLPPPPSPDPRTEIVAPFWENTGNWIDLSKLTNTTFESMFGVAIELADFNKVVAVEKAALVNTDDDGNRLQIQDSIDCSNAAMYITDSAGNVVDTMLYLGEPTGTSVLVPTGSNYYVVISSDTGNAKVRKWDTTQVNTIGSTPWEDFFGIEFGAGIFYDKTKVIPAGGISLAFTVPITSDSVACTFSTIEVIGFSTTRTGSVNQTVGDYTSEPTQTWGTGGDIIGGINLVGGEIDLIPGETYFFNVRNNSPRDGSNLIHLRFTYDVK